MKKFSTLTTLSLLCLLCAGCGEKKELPPFMVFDCPVKLDKNEACIWDDDYNYFIADTTSYESLTQANKMIDSFYMRRSSECINGVCSLIDTLKQLTHKGNCNNPIHKK